MAKRYRDTHDPTRTCPACGISYGRFMAGQFGKGDKAHQASVGALKESHWTDHVENCGAGLDRVRHGEKLRGAADLLDRMLALGPCEARAIERAAMDAGICIRYVRTAKREAGIVSRKLGHDAGGAWIWEKMPF